MPKVDPVNPAEPSGDRDTYLERMQRGLGNNDPELAKANKGYNAVEKEKLIKQRELDMQDQAAKDKAKRLMEFAGSIFSKSGEPVKKAKGGMTASKRADGIAQRGKTRGKIV